MWEIISKRKRSRCQGSDEEKCDFVVVCVHASERMEEDEKEKQDATIKGSGLNELKVINILPVFILKSFI